MLTKRLVNSGLFLYEGNFYDYQISKPISLNCWILTQSERTETDC